MKETYGIKHLGRGIRRSIDQIRSDGRSWVYCRQDSDSVHVHRAIEASVGKDALLAVVAFNRPDLIDLQASSLRKHFGDTYHYVVLDNSSEDARRSEIRQVCDRGGATYVPLPRNPMDTPSRSHGVALNWFYRNLVRRVDIEYVGLLDHDIMPVRSVSYRGVVRKQGAYGHFQRAGQYFFYWPGLFFFSSDFFSSTQVNFLPTHVGGVYLDTGGANWRRHYSGITPEDLLVFDLEDVRADDPSREFDKLTSSESMQEAAFTLFDRSWVHLVNGSNWAGVEMSQKMNSFRSFLNSCNPVETGKGDESE